MSLPEVLAALVVDTPDTPRRLFGGVEKDTTVFLRAADKATMDAAFVAAGIVAPEGQTLPQDFNWPGVGDISILGVIYNDDAVFDEAGKLVTPPTAKPGWHVNVLSAP